MGAFVEGLGFFIRIVVLLFTWLMVATFVSPQLASVMGAVVIVLWLLIFLPLNFIREVSWQNRQKQIMETALAQAPSPYAPGSALPPPPDAVNEQGLVVMQNSEGHTALDVWRELPDLPALEPRRHSKSFWRSFSLPLIGLFMVLGAQNDTFIHFLLEKRGIADKPAIAFDRINVPADKQDEMMRAARMTLRRESQCAFIASGHLEQENQFKTDGRYVYVFDCQTNDKTPTLYPAWIAPEDTTPSSLSSLFHTFSAPVPMADAHAACVTAANAALAPMHSQITAGSSQLERYDAARPPYGGSARLISREGITHNDTPSSIVMNCWIDPSGNARVRFGR